VSPLPESPVTAFVLAGGASERMGRDKALLPWQAGDLLGHALARLRQISADVRLLTGSSRRYLTRDAPVHVDVVAGLGPLGGVLTALEVAPEERALVLAVDLPRVPVALLAFLVAQATGFDLVVPTTTRGLEPLCAVYARTCLPAIRAAAARGDLKLTSFWPGLRVRTIAEAELTQFGDTQDLFANINSPADYARHRARETVPAKSLR
jgi:molybdopterin-guanine dinucleotide biosynthesis protein A